MIWFFQEILNFFIFKADYIQSNSFPLDFRKKWAPLESEATK